MASSGVSPGSILPPGNSQPSLNSPYPLFPIFTLYFITSWELCKFQKNKKARAGTPTTDHLPCRTLSCEQVFLYLNVNSLHMFLLSPVYAPLQARAPRLVCTKLRDRRRRGAAPRLRSNPVRSARSGNIPFATDKMPPEPPVPPGPRPSGSLYSMGISCRFLLYNMHSRPLLQTHSRLRF